MKRLLSVVTFVLVLAAGGSIWALGDPFVGTWKLNLALSKYNPGPPPKSQTRTWEPSGNVSVKGIDATGKPMMYGYPVKNDGKDYPITGAIPNGADTVVTKRVDANTVEAIFKKAGKAVETTRFVLSENGKVLTISAKGTNATGPFNNVTVWDVQAGALLLSTQHPRG